MIKDTNKRYALLGVLNAHEITVFVEGTFISIAQPKGEEP